MATALNPALPILIVDDEQMALDGFEIALVASGYNNVVTMADSRKVMPFLKSNKVEMIFLDLVMPHINGLELLDNIRCEHPDTLVVIVSAVSEIESVVSCVHMGALDYILKPVDNDTLCSRVRKYLDMRELERENQRLRESLLHDNLKHPEAFDDIITEDPAMLGIFRYCEAVATSRKPVLITGETGTGKELIARAVHRLSGRAGEFVAINVAAFDDAMFADALFGHVKGAFTSAAHARQGLVARAWGGTLFLDEIGDLPLTSQVKLLRLLQEEEYFPVGSDIPKSANVRVVSSTLKNLEELKQNGTFREDLYFRFATHHVHLPPLRNRPDDIELLLQHFIELEAQELEKKTPSYHRELPALLRSYSFPGNLREFRAMVSDAMVNHTSRMLSSATFSRYMDKQRASTSHPENQTEEFIPKFEDAIRLPTLKEAQDKVARALIARAMKLSGGNQTIAARHLGITQQALSLKLKKLKSLKSSQPQQRSNVEM